MTKIVIDTNIILSGLRSNSGASYLLLKELEKGKFTVNLSVPLVFEYESTLCRADAGCPLSVEEVRDVLDYLCMMAVPHEIHYLWRPFLSDPKDDMVLELAVASGSEFIVTYNLKDFQGIGCFGVKAVTPRDLLQKKRIL